MPSFSSEHAPPYPAAGPDIPPNVRSSLLGWFYNSYNVRPAEVWQRLRHEEGFSTDWQETTEDILMRFGQDAAQRFYNATANVPRSLDPRITADDSYATPSLQSVPTPLFLDALQLAIELVGNTRSGQSQYGGYVAVATSHINRLFEKRGIHYRMNEGRAEWHGDAGTYREVIAPALTALEDPALAGCRTEFEDALANLRRRTTKELEDAIEESAKSVESAMKVVLAEHGVPFNRETAEPLWTLLRDNNIVPSPTKDAILAASRLRNPMGGHGAGVAPREIPAGIPELAVQSAASAITYLAGLLPP
jgi:hypothetical protein